MIGAYSSGCVTTKAPDIGVVVSAHVIGGVAAVKLESVLVSGCTADVAIDVLARLKDGEGRCVAADVRQVDERLAAEGRADGGVHSLQLGTDCHCNFDRLGNASQFEDGVYCQLDAHLNHLV